MSRLVVLTYPKQPELTDSKARRLLQAPPTKRIVHTTANAHKYQEVDGFIPLPSAKHHAEDIEGYREITADSGVYSDTSDSLTEGEETEESDRDDIILDARQATIQELEEQLSLDPTSVPKWLKLLSHSLSTVPNHSKNAPKVRAEISHAVLSRALAAHPVNQKSVTLRLKLLAVGEELWSNEKLYKEWEDALIVGSVELWLRWLDWRVRTPNVGMEDIVSDAGRVLSALDGDEVSKLRILWRVAIAFRDAGK